MKVSYRVTWRYAAILSLLLFILIFLCYTVRASTEPVPSGASAFTTDPFTNFSVYVNALHFITILFLVVFIANQITRDQDHGIAKKHLADGMSVTELYCSRLILITGISVIVAALIYILLILEGMFFKHNDASSFFTLPVIKLLCFVLISIMYYLIIAIMLTALLKNTSYVLLLMIIVFLAEETFIRYAPLTKLGAVVPYLPLTGFYNLASGITFKGAIYSLFIFNLAMACGMAIQQRNYAHHYKSVRRSDA